MSRSVYRYNVSLCYLCVSLTVSVVSVKRQEVTETAKSVTETSRTYKNFTMAVLYVRLSSLKFDPNNITLATFVNRTLCNREVTPFSMVECSKSYCKSCSFQSLQKANGSTKSVSNRSFLLVKSQLPITLKFLILQTLRPNTFHLILWGIWSATIF